MFAYLGIELIMLSQGRSEAQIKQDIAKEEQAKSAAPGHVSKHKVSALGFITTGLELEETQYVA